MSITFERSPEETDAAVALLAPGGLSSSPASEAALEVVDNAPTTLGALPLGAHLVLRCRKDWRTATVARIEPDKITLSVSSPNGRTYRMRRPPDTTLAFHGSIPLLGENAASCWRAGLAHYDVRW